MIIERIKSLEHNDINLLVKDSISEGYEFVQRLIDEYTSGRNKFDRLGEALFIARAEDEIIGICGLNIDPYLNRLDVGRVRHLYVLPKHRGNGIGKQLLRMIVDEAEKHFRILTLYTENSVADKLYRDFGFSRAERTHKASHILELRRTVTD